MYVGQYFTEIRQDRSDAGRPARGKLAIMIPGMGAVATTFVAGVEAVRKGISSPIGPVTQMGTIRLGKRTDGPFAQSERFCAAGRPE
jgi:myo-inositol-1-phosphate synthase